MPEPDALDAAADEISARDRHFSSIGLWALGSGRPKAQRLVPSAYLIVIPATPARCAAALNAATSVVSTVFTLLIICSYSGFRSA